MTGGRQLRAIGRFIRACGAGFPAGIALSAAGVVLSYALGALALALFVNVHSERDLPSLVRLLGVLGVMCVSVPLLMGVGKLLVALSSERGLASVRDALYRKAIHLPPSYFDARGAGEVHSALVNDSRLLGDVLAGQTTSLASVALGLVAAVGVLIWWSWPTVVLMLTLAGVAVTANARFPRRVRDSTEAEQTALAQVMAAGSGLARGILTIKGLGAERRFLAHVERAVGRHKEAVFKRGKVEGWASAAASVTGSGLYPAVKLGAGWMAFRGAISPAGAIGIAQLASQTVQPLTSIVSLGSQLQQGVAAGTRVTELLCQEEDPYASPALYAGDLLQWIELDRVSFTYPRAPTPALTAASLRVKRGEVVAVVGESGSGKSTLLKILCGLYGATRGEARVGDGDRALVVRPGDLRRNSALCPQDLQLFPLTIAENLEMVCPGCIEPASHDGLAGEILRLFEIPELVSELPERWATPVGNLSGGQRQRIAVVRAFLKVAPIVVLDEPTSHLDTEAEQAVMRAVRELAQTRLVIVATHRVIRLGWVDKIVVLDHGRIAQIGTFRDLRQEPGPFAVLYTRQIGESAQEGGSGA